MPPKKDKKERRFSACDDKAAQKACFDGLDDLGKDHKNLHRLSSRKSVLNGEGDVGGGGLTTHDVTINTAAGGGGDWLANLKKFNTKLMKATSKSSKVPKASEMLGKLTSPIIATHDQTTATTLKKKAVSIHDAAEAADWINHIDEDITTLQSSMGDAATDPGKAAAKMTSTFDGDSEIQQMADEYEQAACVLMAFANKLRTGEPVGNDAGKTNKMLQTLLKKYKALDCDTVAELEKEEQHLQQPVHGIHDSPDFDRYRIAFEEFDHDHDGSITVEEFACVLKKLDVNRFSDMIVCCNVDHVLNPIDVEKIFFEIDQDKDGRISFDDYIATAVSRIKKDGYGLDCDTEAEVEQKPEPKQAAEPNEDDKNGRHNFPDFDQYRIAFEEFDHDHDGSITVEEFALVIKKLDVDHELNPNDVEAIFFEIDQDKDGRISFDDYIATAVCRGSYAASVYSQSREDKTETRTTTDTTYDKYGYDKDGYDKDGYDWQQRIRQSQKKFDHTNVSWTGTELEIRKEVDSILLVFTDTATRLNIEFTNEHRIAVEKDFKSQINEHGIVQMKEKVGPMKEYFTNVEEQGFQGMLSRLLTGNRH